MKTHSVETIIVVITIVKRRNYRALYSSCKMLRQRGQSLALAAKQCSEQTFRMCPRRVAWLKIIERVTCRPVSTGCHGFVAFNASSAEYSLRGKAMGVSFFRPNDRLAWFEVCAT